MLKRIAAVLLIPTVAAAGIWAQNRRRQLRQRLRGMQAEYLRKLDQGIDLSGVEKLLRPLASGVTWQDLDRVQRLIELAEEALKKANTPTGIKPIDAEGPLGLDGYYNYRPALAVARDGTWWMAWVAWRRGGADSLWVARKQNGRWSEPVRLSETEGDFLRPAIVLDADGNPWVFYATRVNGDVEVCYRRWRSGAWEPQVNLSNSPGPDFNVEAALQPGGRIVVVWQSWRRGGFDIVAAFQEGDGFGKPVVVSASKFNDWDPVVAAGPKGTWVVWSAFNGTDYDLYARLLSGGRWSRVVRLTRNAAYDLHPWAAVDKDGNPWVAWDNIYIPNHAGTGATQMSGVRRAYAGRRLSCRVFVARLGRGGLEVPATKKPQNGVPLPRGVMILHAGLPRICFDRQGRLWLAHHYLQRLPTANRTYWYPVLIRCFNGRDWVAALQPAHTDGRLEEIALAPAGNGVAVAWQTDRRREVATGKVPGGLKPTEENLRRHFGEAFWVSLGTNGQIFAALAQAPGAAAAKPNLVKLPAMAPDQKPQPPLPWLLKKRYSTVYKGQRLYVYWGDLHRHSNVSRCSVGAEPMIEDHWRYGHDICLYDFLSMTDHSEHTTAFQWWHLNQIADLHYVPGQFVTLFGFEWTSGRYGHKNVIYPKRGEPIFSSKVKGTDTPGGLWKALEGHRAITIPHHPADAGLGTDWSWRNDKFQRLVEIFQACRASYEYDGCPRQHWRATRKGAFVQDALNMGHKLGIIASTDHGYGASYAAVFAPELTRDAIFDALYNRRCYGSTIRGIFVDFRGDGHFMGEEYSTADPPTFTIKVEAISELAEVCIFKNGRKVWKAASKKLAKPGWERGYVQIVWGEGNQRWDGTVQLSAGRIVEGRFYSPETAIEKFVQTGPQSGKWQSYTGRGTDGLILLIEAPRDATIDLRTYAKAVKFRFGDALKKTLQWDAGNGNYIKAGPGPVPGGALGTNKLSAKWTDDDFGDGTSWYYVRVILANGEMAWSSPIWVTKAR